MKKFQPQWREKNNTGNMKTRVATENDIKALERLITESVLTLQAHCYSEAQRQGALGTVFGVDSQLIKDGTYYIIEIDDEVVACGGWSYRSTLFGADAGKVEKESQLDPATDAARVRAFFVSPQFARRGLGTKILEECQNRARERGFSKFELVATLVGEPLYAKHGFVSVERYNVTLVNGENLPVVRMVKE